MEPAGNRYSFQSKTNPKVQITLEFSDPQVSAKAEEEVKAILKDLYIRKMKEWYSCDES